MPGLPFIHVRIADAGLRSALETRLQQETMLEGLVAPDVPPADGDVVVLLSSETSPFECSGLRDQGVQPLVLAPAWSESERAQYLASGATHYLPVELPPSRLMAVLRETVATDDAASSPNASSARPGAD